MSVPWISEIEPVNSSGGATSPEFCGAGATSLKSFALWSLSAPVALRVAAVVLVRATPVFAVSKDVGVVP